MIRLSCVGSVQRGRPCMCTIDVFTTTLECVYFYICGAKLERVQFRDGACLVFISPPIRGSLPPNKMSIQPMG